MRFMIKLPPRSSEMTGIEFELETFNSIVLLGANGSGKTRMSVWLEQTLKKTHRISAQKSLNFPESVSTTSLPYAEKEFVYGYHHDNIEYLEQMLNSHRWHSKPVTHLLDDYERLLVLLHTEEYEVGVETKAASSTHEVMSFPQTKLDIIKEIWEQVFLHRKLEIKAGRIEVRTIADTDSRYNASEMSDGERLVLYFIGSVLCAKDKEFIIVDEPENHLHPSIIKKLWNLIESYRPECKFIFLTHDIDFALTRNNAKLIWIKNYIGENIWDYEDVTNVSLPKDIYLDIIGSRNPIIFVEGTKESSLDYELYQLLFKDYDVIPISSCSKVIEVTKSFNHVDSYHNIDPIGIIDRDRRSQDELDSYKEHRIYSPQVSEVENLFLLKEVIEFISLKASSDFQEVFNEHKKEIFKIFKENLENEAYLHTKYQINNEVINLINTDYPSIEAYHEALSTISATASEKTSLISEKIADFSQYLESEDYSSILKYFNNKSLLGRSKLSSRLGFSDKGYRQLILKTLKKNDSESDELRSIFLRNFDGLDL